MNRLSLAQRTLRRTAVVVACSLVLSWTAGCSNAADEDQDVLSIQADRPSEGLAYSMMADAIGGEVAAGAVVTDASAGEQIGGQQTEGQPIEGQRNETVIVVPTDDALLALDADALARIAADSSLGALVRSSVVRAGFEWPLRAGDTFLLTSGDPVLISEQDGTIHLNGFPVVETVQADGLRIVVVDGLIVDP